MRYHYIKQLIKGVRAEIEKVMENSEVRKLEPDCVRADWLDASILCQVIEEDIEFTQFSNIDENIAAVEFALQRLASDNFTSDGSKDEQTERMMEVLDVLNTLKPRCETQEEDYEYHHIKYALRRLALNSGGTSNFADAIMKFFNLSNSFFVNACVFKEGMDDSLIRYIMKETKEETDVR